MGTEVNVPDISRVSTETPRLTDLIKEGQPKTFKLPKIVDLERRWISELPYYHQIIATGWAEEYSAGHRGEWYSASQHQSETGDNQKVIEYIKKRIQFVEERLHKKGVTFTNFKDYQERLLDQKVI